MVEEKRTEDNKNIFIIIGIIVIIIVIGFVLSGGDKVEEGPGEGTPDSGTTTPQTQEEIDAIQTDAINTQDTSFCEQIRDTEKSQRCGIYVIQAKANVEMDPTICNQIEDETIKIACKDNIIISRAINEGKTSICETMSDRTRIGQCREYVLGN